MNNLRQVRKIVYHLKRRIGHPIKILKISSIDQDLQTGDITHSDRVIEIRRAIVVTAKEIRDFSYDLSYIAANKNFTYGGFFDQSKRVIIIDGRDLPTDYTPNLNDRCIYNNTRWEFKSISPTAENVGWLLQVQQLKSQPVENTFEQVVQDKVIVQEDKPWLQ